jgi:hypothetical protein
MGSVKKHILEAVSATIGVGITFWVMLDLLPTPRDIYGRLNAPDWYHLLLMIGTPVFFLPVLMSIDAYQQRQNNHTPLRSSLPARLAAFLISVALVVLAVITDYVSPKADIVLCLFLFVMFIFVVLAWRDERLRKVSGNGER